jgi:hypothetical protein
LPWLAAGKLVQSSGLGEDFRQKIGQKSALAAVDFGLAKRNIIAGLSQVLAPHGAHSRVGFFVLALPTNWILLEYRAQHS